MEWTLAALENVATPKAAGGFQLGADPSWAAAAALTDDALFALAPPSTPSGRGEVGDLEFDAGLRN